MREKKLSYVVTFWNDHEGWIDYILHDYMPDAASDARKLKAAGYGAEVESCLRSSVTKKIRRLLDPRKIEPLISEG